MKNRLAMEKIKITGVSIWLKCSRLINPKQPRTTNIINQSHGRLLFPPKFWLTIPEMVKRSPQSLYFNMGNLTLGLAMSGFDDFAISMPRKRINEQKKVVVSSSPKGFHDHWGCLNYLYMFSVN